MTKRYDHKKKHKGMKFKVGRLHMLVMFFLFLGVVTLVQLFRIQILHHDAYIVKAGEQYTILKRVPPNRGEIFWRDLSSGDILPFIINTTVYNFYVVPKKIDHKEEMAKMISDFFHIEYDSVMRYFADKLDPYELVQSQLREVEKEQLVAYLKERNVKEEAYGFEEELKRYYIESRLTSHISGFYGFDEDGIKKRGKYGVEEYFDEILKGKEGIVLSEKDVQGRPIPVGRRIVEKAIPGATVILTLDRNIQYKTCTLLKEYVKKFGAVSGGAIIMDPMDGKVYALCNVPDFDPNIYGTFDQSIFVNPAISGEYEPGSTMKSVTMAAALATGGITPESTYTDSGRVAIDKYVITNAGGRSYGLSSMIDVLDKSINTGAIYAMRSIGPKTFASYVDKFGFGKLTGIELAGESDGSIRPLNRGQEIYAATASYGQGITITPMQLVVAYAAIARGGIIVKPTIVEKVIYENTEESRKPTELERVIDEETARELTSMLVSTVENGYSKKAHVTGYKIAGKSGTAEIPKSKGRGYSDETIHSFIGFGPVGEREPKFVILVKLDKVTEVRYGSDSAAPLFAELAQFVLNYFEVPPDK